MTTSTHFSTAIRSAGFWLAVAMVLSQLVNALRVALDPMGFAAYMGLPLAVASDAGWVGIYGLRALFLGGFAGCLLAMRRYRELGWMALAAIVLPAGDLLLAARAGAADGILIRHALIGVVLIAASLALSRLAKRVG